MTIIICHGSNIDSMYVQEINEINLAPRLFLWPPLLRLHTLSRYNRSRNSNVLNCLPYIRNHHEKELLQISCVTLNKGKFQVPSGKQIFVDLHRSRLLCRYSRYSRFAPELNSCVRHTRFACFSGAFTLITTQMAIVHLCTLVHLHALDMITIPSTTRFD